MQSAIYKDGYFLIPITGSGNVLVIGGSSAVVISLTWGGVTAPWSSPRVLVPLFVGLGSLAAFLIFETLWAVDPIVSNSIILV